MDKQFLLVVYDISNDRRRTKLHNLLLDFGTPVQYSVFECLLAPDEAQKMKQAVRKIIRPQKDNVRYYSLCEACLKKAQTTIGAQVLSQEPREIVV